MITYDPLIIQLMRKRIPKVQLERDGVCSRNTIAKFSKPGEYIALEVIDKLCAYLNCRVEDVIRYEPDDTT